MTKERRVEELAGTKRIVREYSAEGALLRVRILPLPPEPKPSRSIFGKAKPSTPSAAEHALTRAEPVAPPPPIAAPEPPPAPSPPWTVRARFADEPTVARTIEVTLEALPPLAPLPALAPVPAAAPVPAFAPVPAAAPVPPPTREVHVRLTEEASTPSSIDVSLEEIPEPTPLPPLTKQAPGPEPVAEAPALVAAPPPTPVKPVHTRLASDEPRSGTIDVELAALAEPAPLPSLTPARILFSEPEPLIAPQTEAALSISEPAPPHSEIVLEAVRAAAEEPAALPPTKPLRFEILAIEPILALAAEPTQGSPMSEGPAASAPAPMPVEAAPAPEPAALEASPEEEEPLSAAAEPAVPESEPHALEPIVTRSEPEFVREPVSRSPPRSYVALVPKLDERVDALLALEDAPAKRRKRAPIPAPAFEPLAREAWETRLDAALSAR